VSDRRAAGDLFASAGVSAGTAERVTLLVLLLMAALLRLYRLADVPPGLHNDEVINLQIVDQAWQARSWSVYYSLGEGREGLYHPLLALSRALVGQVPLSYRLPSVACGLITLSIVYRLARGWFGPWTALTTAAGLAVAFWPVHLGREVLRVVSFLPLAAGMALAFWRGLERPSLDRAAWGWFGLAGVLLGLSQYAYLAARAVPLVVASFGLYLACFHTSRLRVHWRGLLVVLAVAALIVIPLAVYLVAHQGEQARIGRLNAPLQALSRGDPQPVISSTVAALGMFVWRGDPQSHYNLPSRPVLDPVTGVLFIGGCLLACLGLRRPANAFCLIWMLVMLVPTMLSQPAPHFVRASGAMLTAFVFPGLAVGWIQARLGRGGRIALTVALSLLLSANFVFTFQDYFDRWANLDEVRAFRHAGLAELAHYLDRAPADTPLAACTPFLNESHYFWRSDRQVLPYLMNRSGLTIGWYNCEEAQIFLRGGEQGRYLFGDDLGFASFAPTAWAGQAQTEAVFRDSRLLRVEGVETLGQWLSELIRPDQSRQTFGRTMEFVGYAAEPAPASAGGTIELLTAWRVLTPPPVDLAIFVHLTDGQGRLVAQGDALSALADTLQPGDVFGQRHVVHVPTHLSSGSCALMTGLYVRTGGRLPLDSGEGDSLALGLVEVIGAGD
jgi:4-amino-4-deoxy-L-arabinose transferase-like glycosyltransferase